MNEETEKCLATVTFNDGEERRYVVAANHGIAGHLMSEAGRTGILYMRGEGESWSIPVRNIREWNIRGYFVQQEPKAPGS